ncbi:MULTISPECIES: hypothetical protein [Acinetobacter]|uniref:hypothetical protein n=1 Tax=Acinetobacter TaxID=469 RepID=UPI000BDEFE7D|nr:MULTISPECIES: hypothetical protein [Acinetobacter]
MSEKTKLHQKFESIMKHDIKDFIWNEDIECYDDYTTQICWLTFLNATDSLMLDNHCMIGQTWFMKGTPVSALIKYAEEIYKTEAIAQNSKIKFSTDDNENWFAHDVPFFGTVQILKEFNEWDIHFGDCWQGPFNSKARCIQHLEECIQEMREEQAQEDKSCQK